MAYEKPFIKVTFGGTLADGNDIWSCGFHVGNFGTGTPAETLSFFETNKAALATSISDFYNDERSRTPRGAEMEWVKFALIGTDGKYMDEPILVEEFSQGGLGLPYVPQVSCVISMVTSKFRDPGKYSRFYLPTVAPSGITGYKMTSSETTGVLNSAKDFIQDFDSILNTAGPGQTLGISAISKSGSGAQYVISKVRVGEVLDTQRRRRNSIPENMQEVSL